MIDDYIARKDARADRMAEKLYEKGRKDERCIRIRKTDPQMATPVCHCYSGTGSDNKNEKLRESLEELLKCSGMEPQMNQRRFLKMFYRIRLW